MQFSAVSMIMYSRGDLSIVVSETSATLGVWAGDVLKDGWLAPSISSVSRFGNEGN